MLLQVRPSVNLFFGHIACMLLLDACEGRGKADMEEVCRAVSCRHYGWLLSCFGNTFCMLKLPWNNSFSRMLCVLQTSRQGRVRYPPLAFWMHETKVHDKQGGAIAIQRPAPSPASLTHQRPRPHLGPGPLARGPSQAQLGTQARQPAISVTPSHAQTKPDSHAEAQSQMQAVPLSPEMDGKGSKGAAKQVQRSRKRKAISADAASSKPPGDPPSPPFPYPILAKRAPLASRAAPGLDGMKQAAQKHSLTEQSKPLAGAAGNIKPGMATAAAADASAGSGKKPPSKGKASRQIASSKAADHGGRALGHCSNESEAGPSAAPSSAAAAAAAATAQGGGQVGASQSKAMSKLKRCGTCKNCLKAKSAHQGCLVLRAIREQQAASASRDKPQAAAYPAKSTAAVAAAVPAAVAEPAKAAEAKLGHSLASKNDDKATKCIKGSKAKAGSGAASRQAGTSNRSSKTPGGRASKVSKAGGRAEGCIHAALTQAVELASDMEQPNAAEAAEALKNSPVGSGASQPAASGPLAAASGQIAAAAVPEGSSGEAADEGLPAKRGRGRPRKPVSKTVNTLASVGPKRGRGRPRKSSSQPGAADGVQASGRSDSLPDAPAHAAQLETNIAQAVPVKVSNLSSVAVCSKFSCFTVGTPLSKVQPCGLSCREIQSFQCRCSSESMHA